VGGAGLLPFGQHLSGERRVETEDCISHFPKKSRALSCYHGIVHIARWVTSWNFLSTPNTQVQQSWQRLQGSQPFTEQFPLSKVFQSMFHMESLKHQQQRHKLSSPRCVYSTG